ncbi:TonB-dependent receptor [Flavobacterium sp. JP2137]|uniref:TonB-dependent receptor n=1 Tax=Flavobacterium sp. JP2137 TaxID=3414510 RepID=UPI003D2FC6B8
MKLHVLLLALLFTCSLYSQNGTLKGKVSDSDAGLAPLAFATISIAGTTLGTSSDANGQYQLSLPSGKHTVLFSYLGYDTQSFGITIAKGETKTQSASLSSNSTELEGVVVQATSKKAKETALLLDQHRSLEIKQNIGAQELSRKGISDVAAAVAKTTGVVKQEGSGAIFVRGLGDRYNATSMNGLPIPSNDPERKNISLDLFSTDIVEYISIDKTYSSRIFGDFAGGHVDIISKDHSGEGFFNFSIGSQVNSNAVKQDQFLLLSDRNYLGFSKNDTPQDPLKNYQFTNSLNLKNRAPYGSNFGFNTGKSFNIGQQGQLNLFATASFDNKYKFKEGMVKSVQAQGDATKDFATKEYEYATNTTGMFNAQYSLNPDHKIGYNLLYINGSSESNEEYRGYMRDLADGAEGGFLRRGNYVQNTLLVNQLLGEHKLNEQFKLNWGASYNTIKSDMPDRIQNTFRIKEGDYYFTTNSVTDNHRYYQNLNEDEVAGRIALDYKFGKKDDLLYRGKWTVGYSSRFKNLDFQASQFNYRLGNALRNVAVDPYNLDAVLNKTGFENGDFQFETFLGDRNLDIALTPQTYEGKQSINGGYTAVEYELNPKWSAVVGLRVEQISQEIKWKTQLDLAGDKNTFEKTAFLPNLSLKYALNDRNNFRLAASKTYTLPQFKERGLFMYEKATGSIKGNPDLYPSDDYNLDLKWEFFPENDEIFSLTAFGKYIQNPINEITITSSSDDISFANTGDSGYAAGIELEIRKNLFTFDDTHKITGGLNAAYMRTHQELDSEKVRKENAFGADFTHDTASFTGAADLVMNADLSYIKEWNDRNIMATISYAYISDRIYSLGSQQLGNSVDKGFGTLDFIFKTKLSEKLGLGINAKNLLDPKLERVQENLDQNILVQSYKLGKSFSLSLNYQF